MLIKKDCESELVLCMFMPRKNLHSLESSQVNIIGTSQKCSAALGYFTPPSQTFSEDLIVCSILHGVTEYYISLVPVLHELEPFWNLLAKEYWFW